MIVKTGVFASADQRAEARERSQAVRNAPVIRVHGEWIHEVEAEAFKSWLDQLAVSCGLPEPGTVEGEPNHYGMTSTGEFLRYEPDALGEEK